MHLKSGNIEVMTFDNADEVINFIPSWFRNINGG